MKKSLVPLAVSLWVTTAVYAQEWDQQRWQSCRAELIEEAQRRGVSAPLAQRLLAKTQPDPQVLALLDRQPEFITPIWQYLANLVDSHRIALAQAKRQEHWELLQRVERAYGVEAELIVAFWAVESNFGNHLGRFDLVRSLATLSCFGRRQSFFRGEFLTLAELIARGDITQLPPRGSWAGAFGHTQFMPSTFATYAVDFDGDGVRDLFGSLADVFASTANFLAKSGWQYGEPWGVEVRLPVDWKSVPVGRQHQRPLSQWAEMGITLVDGRPLVSQALPDRAALLLPAGKDGPALLVFRNYQAIWRYNAAESYALAVGLLFDALKDPKRAANFDPGQPFATPWPADDPPMTRSETEELQTILAHYGFYPSEAIDGVMGPSTREALRQFQAQCLNQEHADGWPGRHALKAVRAAAERGMRCQAQNAREMGKE